MPTTSNKGYNVPATGDDVDTWGVVLNGNFSTQDLNLGGIAIVSLGSITPVTLNDVQSSNLILRLTGTITQDITVLTECLGMTMVENRTSGGFRVLFGLDGVGSAINIPQNTSAVVITDQTNGARVAADNQTEFASATRIVFQQSAAPTGWTKDVSGDNRALRLTSGAVGSGGTQGFTGVFTQKTPSGSVGGTSLSANQLPPHQHNVTSAGTRTGSASQNPGVNFFASSGDVGDFGGKTITSSSIGNGDQHNHSFTGNMIDFSVLYTDVIIAQKN